MNLLDRLPYVYAAYAAELLDTGAGWYPWHQVEAVAHAKGPQRSCPCAWCVKGLSCCRELMHV